MKSKTAVYIGDALSGYHFGVGHPFGPERYPAFLDEFNKRNLIAKVQLLKPVYADMAELELFHTSEYIRRVAELSSIGQEFLDQGDTPARKGILEDSLVVVGSVLDAIDQIMNNQCTRAFIPIAGLHHARRHSAAGFCVFNDCGLAIEVLKKKYHLTRIAYIDIDAHHGDGVFYSFESDPHLIFVDTHEDGRFLYPGTGFETETGQGDAVGTKLNFPLPPGADDQHFFCLWPKIETFLHDFKPEFFLLQCGADSLEGDPITHMKFSTQVHRRVAAELCKLADTYANGKFIAMGGGGYNLANVASAWNEVVEALSDF